MDFIGLFSSKHPPLHFDYEYDNLEAIPKILYDNFESYLLSNYEWRLENWGTKWDVCEAEIDHDGLAYSDDQKVAWFSFKCWTAWAPPVPVWDKLHAMGIEVQADYQDEGMNFEGAYRDGEESNWTIVHEEEAV